MPLNIVSVLPDVATTGIILQGAVIVTFDQEIDASTYSEGSFLLSAPPEIGQVSPDALLRPVIPSGNDYVQGTFSFAINSLGGTVATFKPSRPMRPNVKYTVLITTDVATAAGASLSGNYSWSFTTGFLNLTTPPPQNPLPAQMGRLKCEDLVVTPASTINNDLHRITINFPYDIDPNSFRSDDITVGLEAFLQDLDVYVPPLLTKTVTVSGKQLVIDLTF